MRRASAKISRLVHHFPTAVEFAKDASSAERLPRYRVRVLTLRRAFLDTLQFLMDETMTNPIIAWRRGRRSKSAPASENPALATKVSLKR